MANHEDNRMTTFTGQDGPNRAMANTKPARRRQTLPTHHSTLSTRHSSAFSLVEILVIIVILALLLGILAPAGIQARKNAMNASSRASIMLLDQACEMYKNDFGEFPLSNVVSAHGYGSTMESMNGAQLITFFLTGYPDNPGTKGTPDSSDFGADDGKDGFGFRTVQRGRVYGPYNGAENVNVVTPSGWSSPAFADAFDKPIYYFRYRNNSGTMQYVAGDNGDVIDQDYLDDDAAPVRRDFIFWSAGANGDIDKPATGAFDDITNWDQ